MLISMVTKRVAPGCACGVPFQMPIHSRRAANSCLRPDYRLHTVRTVLLECAMQARAWRGPPAACLRKRPWQHQHDAICTVVKDFASCSWNCVDTFVSKALRHGPIFELAALLPLHHAVRLQRSATHLQIRCCANATEAIDGEIIERELHAEAKKSYLSVRF